MTAQVDERRHVAIFDGERRIDVVLSGRATLGEALVAFGVDVDGVRRVLVDRDGRQVDPATAGDRFDDGSVVTLIDPLEHVQHTARNGGHRNANDVATPAIGGALGAFGVVVTALALLTPPVIDPVSRTLLTVVAGAGAVIVAAVWAVRSRRDRPSTALAIGALALAFCAGVVAVPTLPAAGRESAVFAGLAFSGVLAAALVVLATRAADRARLGVTAVIVLCFAALWGAAVLLGLPSAAPCAAALGAVPVALRTLPAFLLDVPPGVFIDYPSFQSTRWAVRERTPEPIDTVPAKTVRALVERSFLRLMTATLLLSAVAAVSAPFAFGGPGGFVGAGPITSIARMVLATSVTVSLVLGARRISNVTMRWMPRAAATIVAGVALVEVSVSVGAPTLVAGAAAALTAGVVTAVIVVPISRGARSLFWSRFADVLDVIAVVLALPAGIVAAGAIDLLRGAMAS